MVNGSEMTLHLCLNGAGAIYVAVIYFGLADQHIGLIERRDRVNRAILIVGQANADSDIGQHAVKHKQHLMRCTIFHDDRCRGYLKGFMQLQHVQPGRAALIDVTCLCRQSDELVAVCLMGLCRLV